MQLRPLTLKDKPFFDECASHMDISLSSYAFAPLYIWKDHFDFYWTLLGDYFCVFAKQSDDYFMPIGPVGPISNAYQNVAREVYQFMLETNRNPQIARIENVPQETRLLLEENGFRSTLKETEYLYEIEALTELKGNRYKSKRHPYNAFVARHASAKLNPYSPEDRGECLVLYDRWSSMRTEKCNDEVYLGMLEDSRCALQIGLTHAEELGLIGRVVRTNGRISGWTFGYRLTPDTFCILFEVTDLAIKGLAQFIYREFARELGNAYRWINAMGDSGLANLARVKRSYHPARLILSYNIFIS